MIKYIKLKNILFFLFISFIFTSCNHLYYQPDKETYRTPNHFKLKFDEIKVTTEDNQFLTGWLIHAKNEKPVATIVHFHGNAENMTSHFLYFAWMTEKNYDVIEFDYRGYGRSSGKPSRLGLYQDTITFLQWVKENKRTKNVFIIAQSLGTAVIIPAFSDFSFPEVKAIVLESSFSSYRKLAKRKLSDSWLTWLFQWPLSYLISDELSPIDYIQNIHVPLLFIHSKNDPIVPYESGRELFDKANQPKEFWLIAWNGHTAAFNQADGRYRERLLEYLKKYDKR